MSAFGALVPGQFASKLSGLKYWSNSSVPLNIGSASGYDPSYQNTTPDGRAGDPSWNGDQAHHFAAFLEFGYQWGAFAGAIAAADFEAAEALLSGSSTNYGDVRLGAFAVQLGSDLKAHKISSSEVSCIISQTICKH